MKHLTLTYKLLCLAFIIVSLNSCKEQEDHEIMLSNLNDEYIIFGHFFGECIGEGCIETYALTADKLYEDTNDIYQSTDFEFVELPAEKFDLVIGLENSFPLELIDATEEVFGCPDCGDWGGIYVGYIQGGVKANWIIDTKLDDVPAYLHDFVTEIQEKIQLIN